MFDAILDYLREDWPKLLTILVAAVGSFLAGRGLRRRWKKRDFLHRLNVSLTSIEGGILRIRTLLEMDCEEIFLNASASKEIVKLAKRTTTKDPILPIDKADCWQYLNAVLNEISERFAEGQVRRDMGLPVVSERYVLCLTREAAGTIRTQKLRCLVTKKSLLEKLPEQSPAFEATSHGTRWETLQFLAAEYRRNPHRFIEMEICFAVPGTPPSKSKSKVGVADTKASENPEPQVPVD